MNFVHILETFRFAACVRFDLQPWHGHIHLGWFTLEGWFTLVGSPLHGVQPVGLV